jgi:hypothetical protein
VTRTLKGLDLFARGGGSTAGYQRVGFHMTAVDIVDRSAVNPAEEFVVADAFEFLFHRAREFDFIHAGPPCQARNPLVLGTNGGKGGHVDLLGRTQDVLRHLLSEHGIRYVIEQPPGAHSLRRDVMLCCEMFPALRPEWNGHGDLVKPAVIRHRYFEVGGFTVRRSGPPVVHQCPRHRGRVRGVRHGEHFDGPYVAVYGEGGYKATIPEAQAALGINWLDDRTDLNEAIPPAFTGWLGGQLFDILNVGTPR